MIERKSNSSILKCRGFRFINRVKYDLVVRYVLIFITIINIIFSILYSLTVCTITVTIDASME